MAAPGVKKNFEFRMSKKVAELTQVVHMLFTRNHEKEVEMDALKAAYECEISLVLEDARTKIQNLDQRLGDMEREKHTLGESIEASLKDGCQRREAELTALLTDLQSQLAEEKKESQNSRDLLIQTQKDLEQLRKVHLDDSDKTQLLLDRKDRDLTQLRYKIGAMEQELRDKNHLLDTKSDLLRTHEKLRKEMEHVKVTLQAVEKVKEEISSRNRHLDADVKALKKELAKRVNDRNSAKVPAPVANGYTNTSEELDKLKKELARYKMELSNRENNFNRMFTEKQPVHVNDREPRRTSTRGRRQAGSGLDLSRQYTSVGPGVDPGSSRLSRDSQYSNEVFTEEELRELSGTPVNKSSRSHSLKSAQSSGSDRLPQLDKLHALNLVKPRLPRELITGKR